MKWLIGITLLLWISLGSLFWFVIKYNQNKKIHNEIEKICQEAIAKAKGENK